MSFAGSLLEQGRAYKDLADFVCPSQAYAGARAQSFPAGRNSCFPRSLSLCACRPDGTAADRRVAQRSGNDYSIWFLSHSFPRRHQLAGMCVNFRTMV